MTGVCALDLSKSRTGFAVWQPGWDKPRYGSWRLGTEWTSDGGVYAAIHVRMAELRAVMPFRTIYFEEPILPANLSGKTNIRTLKLAAGIAAHVESFAEATGCMAHAVNVGTWRKDFVGADLVKDAQAAARAKRAITGKGSARDKLKALTVERCRQLGMSPRSDDEADAIGILDFALDFHEHVTVPWRANEVLRPPLGVLA
ncbi:MAG TPA: hypothetical protein VNR51_03790 [Hyphomicrobium sp.]|nr:hypothetical protein [Hyphomicrobium sp.]